MMAASSPLRYGKHKEELLVHGMGIYALVRYESSAPMPCSFPVNSNMI